MNDEPLIARKAPYPVELRADTTYHWCSCGRSKSQPFCDGSHAGTSFQPLAFKPEQDGKAYLCGCKHTANAPYCDGTHQKL